MDRHLHPSQPALCMVWPSQPGLLASASSIAVAQVKISCQDPVDRRLQWPICCCSRCVALAVYGLQTEEQVASVGSVSNSLAGLDWVAGHLQKPAVVLLSLGLTDDASSHALDQVCRSCQIPPSFTTSCK